MSIAARAGKFQGSTYLIKTKDSGEVIAEVNKKKQTFNSVLAATEWIEDEIKRRNRK